MVGPIIAKLVSVRELGNDPQEVNEPVIILEIDINSGRVLIQRADNRLYVYPLYETVLESDMRLTKLAPAGPRLG